MKVETAQNRIPFVKGVLRMPSVSKVKLNICGSEYAITSDETEEYVRELAGQVDRDMRALLHADDRISTTMAAVLVAIIPIMCV